MTGAARSEARADPRPERGEAQEAILNAAELVFAENGFHGATTRAIAERAQANAALIHYYFGSKEALYEAVIARRSGAINDERRARVAELHASGAMTLETLLDALLRPTITLGRDASGGGAAYARLLGHAAAGTDERSHRVTSSYYDAIARLFISELAAVVPGLSRNDAVRGYMNAISIGISLMAPTGRINDLSDGQIADDDLEEIIIGAVRFIAAGIRALGDSNPRHGA
ncbi:TetR/AcrR family transcriptional regulator [Pararhodobacter sp. CCB-MM2]|uniref:TetR/AcrR family transcriptional regulator n=1 Tax=Pararhodobacter sp. CCB-MM2 TaxID=1786003 RepID=UPI0009F2B5A5|nr:TetR/AcrR family transcriptional regulator [Pararhodobacter sp. CCB-MM2]